MTITALSLLAGAIVTVGLLVIVAAFRPAPVSYTHLTLPTNREV